MTGYTIAPLADPRLAGSIELEEAREMERLQRRAYGPNADIEGDAAAQARLADLEAAQRRRAGLEPAEDEPSVESFTDQQDTGAPTVDAQPADGGPTTGGWHLRRSYAILGGVVAAAALVAAGAFLAGYVPTPVREVPVSPPEPDYVIAPDYGGVGADDVLVLIPGGDPPHDPNDTLGRLGLRADEMRRYTNFGYLSVWSGASEYGTTCLLVAHPVQGLNEGIGAEGCSPAGVDPVADLLLPNSSTGMLLRFVLKGDHVGVYVYERADEPTSWG